ncbi:hypothetical protein ACFL6U_09345 [Planctomycetota bacterium]
MPRYRYKWIWPFLLVSIVIVCYGGVVTLLRHWDDSPRWAQVKYPKVAILGSTFRVSVRYHHLKLPVLLDVSLVLKDDQRRTCGQLTHKDLLPTVVGSGERSFSFLVDADPNMETVRVIVQRREVPVDPNTPVHQCRLLGHALPADEVALLKNPQDIHAWQKERTLRAILIRAYREGSWKDKAGDPEVLGWLVTILYLGTAIICLFNGDWSRRDIRTVRYLWFWWLLGLSILFLGINKQLDLQMLLADIGRTYSHAMGWHSARKAVQIRTVALLVSVSLGILAIISFHMRKAHRSTWIAIGGLILIVGVVGSNLVSLPRLGRLLRTHTLGIRLGDLLEIVSILAVGLSAWIYRRKHSGLRDTVSRRTHSSHSQDPGDKPLDYRCD